MQAEDKRDQIKSWFIPEPKLPIVLFTFPIFLLLIGLVFVQNEPGIGLIMVLMGAIFSGLLYMLYMKAKARYSARPSTDQMGQWLQEDLETLKEKSLERMTLDASETIAESVVLKGPIWWADPDSELDESEILRGKTDGQDYLYSCWNISILHITENFLAIYECEYNWPRNSPTNEGTKEYFYQDIVTIATGNETIDKKPLDIDQKFDMGCLGCGCLGFLNPFFYTYLLFNQFVLLLRGAFGDLVGIKSLGFLEPKRVDSGDNGLQVQGKIFEIGLSGGQSLRGLIDSQQLEIWGAKETSELADKAVTAINRRVRDKKADK